MATPQGSSGNTPARNPAASPLAKGAMPATAGATSAQRDYFWDGKFDRNKIGLGFTTDFKGVDHYDKRSLPNLQTMLDFLEADTAVTDLRWMAYILATAYWETGHVESADGKKYWVTMKPVEETGKGKGRPYFLPVKQKVLDSGNVLLTEQDGDQFTVLPNGKYSKASPNATRGSSPNAAATKIYLDNDGVEQAYFGRGYVQLTWWDNYAAASAAAAQALDYLLHPEKVLEPQVAYQIMAFNMRTGKGFANGHKLSDYFSGNDRRYVAARAMVNGTDNDDKIAAIAELFETVLYEARKGIP